MYKMLKRKIAFALSCSDTLLCDTKIHYSAMLNKFSLRLNVILLCIATSTYCVHMCVNNVYSQKEKSSAKAAALRFFNYYFFKNNQVCKAEYQNSFN